ncbi:MAG: hypothetical protein IJU44_13455 [Kiritimatiellae bacterium]|nr:hypothetical protein [Kiritimatiellia bacterium]
MLDSFTSPRDVAEEPALAGSSGETSFDADTVSAVNRPWRKTRLPKRH